MVIEHTFIEKSLLRIEPRSVTAHRNFSRALLRPLLAAVTVVDMDMDMDLLGIQKIIIALTDYHTHHHLLPRRRQISHM